MSVLVILVTFNSTKILAVSLERITDCGYDYDHEHGPECYDASGELTCQLHVHTDACYQTSPQNNTNAGLPGSDSAEEPEESITVETAEAPVEEVEVELGEDEATESESEDDKPESEDIEIEPETLPLYRVGEQYPFLLSDVLNACGLDIPVSAVVEIGQVLDADDARQTLSFEWIEDDCAIYPIVDCEDQELAIITDADMSTVRLVDAIVPEWAKEPGQVPEQDEPEETIPEAAEAIEEEQVEETPVPDETEIEETEVTSETVEETVEEAQEPALTEETEATTPVDETEEAEQAEEIDEVELAEDLGEPESAETGDIETIEIPSGDETEADEAVEEPREETEAEEGVGTEEEQTEVGKEYIETKIEPTKVGEEGDEPEAEANEENEEAAGTVTEEAAGTVTEEAAGTVIEEAAGNMTEEAAGTGTEEAAGTGTEEAAETGTEEAVGFEQEETKENDAAKEPADDNIAEPSDNAADADDTEARTLIIDLAQVEGYPLSLKSMLAHFQAGQAALTPENRTDIEEAPAETAPVENGVLSEAVEDIEAESEAVEPSAEEVEFELGEEPVSALQPEIECEPEAASEAVEPIGKPAVLPAIAYDDALLSVEATEDDYLITPVASFERTSIEVQDTCTILLLNGRVEVAAPMPAQSFEGSTETMVVKVEAGEGAFPEGTTMSLADIDDEDTLTGIGDAAVGQDFVEVQRVHAVDITFVDADGNKIEPLIPISVVMSIRETTRDESTVVVHMDDDGNVEVVQDAVNVTEEMLEAAEAKVEETEAQPTEAAEAPTESVSFVSDTFSVYAVVVTKKLETKVITAGEETYKITVTYTEDAAIPVGATLDVREIEGEAAQTYLDQAEGAVDAGQQIALARFFDIKIMDGENEVQPAVPVMVTAELVNDAAVDLSAAAPCAVHFAGEEPDVVEALETDEAITFRAEGFSVWGLVYTVDFKYEIDGRVYEFSIPGGGFISFSELVEALGITGEANGDAEGAVLPDDAAVSDATRRFVEDVERVEFSSPELLSVSKVDEDTTVGAIKSDLGLACEYSAELTESDIARINATEVAAGDWALISLKAFDTDETLTVTMNTDEVFTIQVTDAQIRQTIISASGEAYEITVTYTDSARIPDDATLKVREILRGDEDYDEYYQKAVAKADGSDAAPALEEGIRADETTAADAGANADAVPAQTPDQTERYARFFDIQIWADGRKVEPQSDVLVTVSLADVPGNMSMAPQVVHFGEGGEELLEVNEGRMAAEAVTEFSFTTDGFSVYGFIGTVIEKQVLTRDGKNFRITVTCGADSGIPENADLEVEEILPEEMSGSDEGLDILSVYDTYVSKTEDALGLDAGTAEYVRLFDISIVDADDHGIKYQPVEGSVVAVRIELADRNSERMSVVHFSDGSEEGEAIRNSTESGENGSVVEFQTGSFSVYSIVDAPEPAHFGPYKLGSLDEIEENTKYQLSYGSPDKYFTSQLNTKGCLTESSAMSDAAEWYFEKDPEDGSAYYIYTMLNGAKKYIHQKNSGSNEIELADSGTEFVLSETSDAYKFTFKHFSEGRYLQHSNGGGGIRFYTDADNAANSRIYITHVPSEESQTDPYGLNGKTFGIAYNDDSASAAALTAESKTVSGQNRLEGLDMLIRTDVLNNNGFLLVSESSDIQEWTFESIEEDKYYIKTSVEGEERYLCINGGNVTLVDDRTAASEIQAIPGTGAYKGKWHFTVNNYSLNFSGTAANGFNATKANNAPTWLNLVERSTLTEEDFVYYSARKISASDEILSATKKDENGDILRDEDGNPVYKAEKAKVIVYTRVWNEETRKYEYYAVDHDGSLVRVYDSGDQINWVGNQVNSALWEFTEYTYDDGTPSDYYELENTAYANAFLAPQSNGVIANHTIGVNMEGRQEGFDYTEILAWDGAAYAYTGLKVEGGRVVTCPRDEADDFYFAVIVPPVLAADPPTTVKTVDNNEHGISMRMIDFNNQITGNRDSVQNPFFGGHAYVQDSPDQGLLTTDLVNGYPYTTASTGNAGRSLSELFTGMTTANHLFIESVYNESGYFEYDSTQNFAHLNDNGNFTVYNQLGAIGTSTGDTRTHGQFMPYNDISAEKGYAYDTSGNLITNKTDVLRHELSDSNPRKGEPLYSIPDNEADYFFGMELSASFTQTPSGLDNWGHDIIFEFTGDDDFWLYVDGELVLDLGGIHSAMPGSVNFRTGEVIVNNSKTSLYEIFRENYEKRGMTDGQIALKLSEVFEEKEVNGKTVHVFRDYSAHTMKMFYMERGAGASNLKMRFNLASVQPGTVELSKKLEGTKSASNKLIQYPYQIWYRMPLYRTEGDTIVRDENGEPIIEDYEEPIQMVQGNTSTAPVVVVYKGSRKLVPFKDTLNIDGTVYQNVFLLKSGETAVIKLPDKNCIYEIIECGVDTEVYEQVSVNGEEITGTLYNNTDTPPEEAVTVRRRDFGIDYESTSERPRAEYSNKVAPGVMRTLSFTKVLYDTDGEPMSPEETASVSAKFSFRLYLGNEFADENNLSPANMYSYYVTAPDGSYCKWNSADQRFDSLGIDHFEGNGGLEEYLSTASSEEKSAVVFTTSLNGSITNIPAGYTVEVRDLIVGTKYKVEEPDREIPKGYTRRDSDGYVRTDLEEGNVVYYTQDGAYGRHLQAGNTITAEPVSDTIANKTESPKIEVRNQEGWGLTAQKEWTDKDFMIHDPIYLAVYLADEQGNAGELIEGSVRRLNTNGTEIYWFFPDLKIDDEPHTFSEFIVREVTLTGTPSVNAVTGVVTGYTGITPVAQGGAVSVGGRTFSGNERTEIYTVDYQTGNSTGQNANIRTDTVTNSRPGIQIYKTDWSGEHYLSGAEFTLKDSNGHDVGHASYTSNSSGLVTTAYLNEGTFTLNEIKAPAGYVALDEPITITVTTTKPSAYDLTVVVGTTTYYIKLSGSNGFYTTVEATESAMARINVKNRTVQELKVVKEGVAGSTREPLSGVHFALYEQVKDSEGNVRPAYSPKSGYEDIVSNENGILEEITMSVGTGTYYLREKAAPSGYKKLTEDLCFSIGEDGTVVVHNAGYSNWLTRDTSVPGTVSYLISIENTPLGITVRKTDKAGTPLIGSQFSLSRKNGSGFVVVSGHGLGENGWMDLTEKTEMTLTGLEDGIYKLTEERAPLGYIILTKLIFFSVADGTVRLTDQSGEPQTYDDVSLQDDNTTIVVANNSGVPLPNTGGFGTHLIYLLGGMLTLIAGTALLIDWRRRRTI